MNRQYKLWIALSCFVASLVLFTLLIITNIETALSNWLIVYSATPPAATAFLYLAASWGVYKNDTDRERWLIIIAMWCGAAIYLLLQWPPAWWQVYGRPLTRIVFTLIPAAIFWLSMYRYRRGQHNS